MANLLWRRGRNASNLAEVPFKTEEELEKVVFDTRAILEDIHLIKRQIRGGGKAGIPDIVGVDKDGSVCIIEMKNVSVNASILPQVLQYAIWAETNPDSIKSLWLEDKDRPEDVTISFEQYEVRIIIIAPTIDRTTLSPVGKIGYPVDLIEIKRWASGKNEFLLVNNLKTETTQRVKPTHGLPTYNKEFYESQFNKNSVAHFLRFVDQTEAFVKRKGWPLERKFNKHYCGFKYGFFNAFSIAWIGSKSFAFKFLLPKPLAQRATPKGIKMTRYEDEWKQAVYKIDPEKTKVNAFEPLFKAAVDKLLGK